MAPPNLLLGFSNQTQDRAPPTSLTSSPPRFSASVLSGLSNPPLRSVPIDVAPVKRVVELGNAKDSAFALHRARLDDDLEAWRSSRPSTRRPTASRSSTGTRATSRASHPEEPLSRLTLHGLRHT